MSDTKDVIEVGESAKMVTADTDFEAAGKELLRVDLACGQMKKSGYIGIDGVNVEGVDIVHDLFKFPWPLKDNSVWDVHCAHFVEHIPHVIPGYQGEGLNLFMEELYRVLMMGGQATIVCPFYTSVRAHQDPTHCRYITDVTFDYYNKGGIGKVDHYAAKCNFEIVHRRYVLSKEYEGLGDEARTWALRHQWNVVDDIQFTLRKIAL